MPYGSLTKLVGRGVPGTAAPRKLGGLGSRRTSNGRASNNGTVVGMLIVKTKIIEAPTKWTLDKYLIIDITPTWSV